MRVHSCCPAGFNRRHHLPDALPIQIMRHRHSHLLKPTLAQFEEVACAVGRNRLIRGRIEVVAERQKFHVRDIEVVGRAQCLNNPHIFKVWFFEHGIGLDVRDRSADRQAMLLCPMML